MYLELTTDQFAILYPHLWKDIPLQLKLETMADKDYRYRVQTRPDGGTAVEIGYLSDKWRIC